MRITTELICRCSSRNLLPGNDDDRNLERITHLYLQEHHIRKIENLECCKNLIALYLYDNKIEKIENLDLLVQLKILYLHSNFIPRIENLDKLSQITVLNLSYNTIERVEGLESLPELRELYIDYQTLPGDQALEFDPTTILFLSENLRVLNVSGNKLERLVALRPLKYLEVFVAEENELSDLEEVAAVAGGWTYLVSLKLAGNPVCGCRKYLDDLVVSCLELEELDGRDIQPSHRNYLLNRKQCLALESLKKESYQVLRPFLETQIKNKQLSPPRSARSTSVAPLVDRSGSMSSSQSEASSSSKSRSKSAQGRRSVAKSLQEVPRKFLKKITKSS